MSVSGELYNLPENCLLRRFQSVILNRQTSSWRPHHVSISQSSIPRQLFFSSISVTLLAIFNLTQNSLPMTHFFLLLLRIRMKILIFSTMVYCWFLNELVIRKCFLYLIQVNQPKKWYFQEKKQFHAHLTISLNTIQLERKD